MKPGILIAVTLIGLAACTPRVVPTERGVGFDDYTDFELERARREAILRMKEDAHRLGANMVINVKLETASISKGAANQIGSVEVYAYGTALHAGEAAAR